MLYNVEPKKPRRQTNFTRVDGTVPQRILKLLRDNPGSTADQLRKLYLKEYDSATSISKHLTKMRKSGLLITKESRVPEMKNRAVALFWSAP